MSETLTSKIQNEWKKGWRERTATSNIMLAVPKVIVGVASFVFEPIPEIRRQYRQEVDRDSKIQINNCVTNVYYKGQECKTIPEKDQFNGTIKSNKKGYHFATTTKSSFTKKPLEYRLQAVNDTNQKHVTNQSGSKLYHIDSYKPKGSVIWLKQDGELDITGAGNTVKKSVTNKLKAITLLQRSEKTAKVKIITSLLMYPISLSALIVKSAGSVIQALCNSIGNGLQRAQDKLLQGEDIKYSATKDNSLGYENFSSKALYKLKYTASVSLGVIGSTIKLIGVTANETIRLASAIISIPSAMTSKINRSIKQQHIITCTKSLVSNVSKSCVELANSATKTNHNIDGKFVPKEQEAQINNTSQEINEVEYHSTKNKTIDSNETPSKTTENKNDKSSTQKLYSTAKGIGQTMQSCMKTTKKDDNKTPYSTQAIISASKREPTQQTVRAR